MQSKSAVHIHGGCGQCRRLLQGQGAFGVHLFLDGKSGIVEDQGRSRVAVQSAIGGPVLGSTYSADVGAEDDVIIRIQRRGSSDIGRCTRIAGDGDFAPASFRGNQNIALLGNGRGTDAAVIFEAGTRDAHGSQRHRAFVCLGQVGATPVSSAIQAGNIPGRDRRVSHGGAILHAQRTHLAGLNTIELGVRVHGQATVHLQILHAGDRAAGSASVGRPISNHEGSGGDGFNARELAILLNTHRGFRGERVSTPLNGLEADRTRVTRVARGLHCRSIQRAAGDGNVAILR